MSPPNYNGQPSKARAGVQGLRRSTANTTDRALLAASVTLWLSQGGFGLGGGHSILSNSHGTGSDNVLEWEVVTMDGRHLPEQNSNLYWAPSGSGPGTFTVVLSMTARLHADGIIGGANLRCNWEFYPFT
ncbi:uncharacterized protein P174DRAFT_487582 [Aspergillus novofumigatus IBT 16806]|uniref:Uncharacterized protein n=1 Tax=Aspergillus novofumigatus (strain IBT 16806) TaxID=1392255 RepID=A0A2I1BS54_ASPN1|nr:uncharacterized protein P174DRAFT_487582 [Aspergillus novofumigatus IBT 16806]PKX88192.1 hypothetical protein P174DRAFT_487582 [Aspergillus novofumigatus IBT 16806]